MMTVSWVRQPRLTAMKVIAPTGMALGLDRSIMCSPMGAVPPIIAVRPMSASTTCTVLTARDGAPQAAGEK